MKIKIISIFILCLLFSEVHAQVDRSKQPQPGPAPKINLGRAESFKLDNGLKVLVVENHKLPRVQASLVIDNVPHAQGNKVGEKSLYSAMMGTGTQAMTKDEFNERIDFLGANVGFGSENAYASSLSKFFPEVLGLMADGLIHPKFDQTEFEAQKSRAIEGIKSNEKNAKAIGRNLRSALAYGKNHPYGEFETEKSVKALSLADVKKYYSNYITPKNAYLVVVGDVKEREVKKLVKENFSDWASHTPPSATLPNVPAVQYAQINLIDVPNALQSEIYVVNTVELKKTDKDYFPVLMANQILGGGGEGRLFLNLREDKSYTYGAYSGIGADKYVSTFTASASVRNAVTDSAVTAFLNEIHKIRDEQVSRQELEVAKAKYTGNFVRALEQPSTIADYALSIETDDLPKDFYKNYLKKVKAVTVEDVQRVAKKYFDVKHQRIVIAGKGSEIAESLENYTYNGKSIPVKYFDKEGNSVSKPEYNKSVPEGVSVQSVYNDYLKAIGGKEAVSKVNSLMIKGSATVQGMAIELTSKQTKEGKSLEEVTMNGMTASKTVFDGEKGYNAAQGQKMELTDEQIADKKANGAIFPELNVSKDAELTGMEKVDSKDAYVVKSSDKETDYYNTKTGLKVQTVTTTPQGNQTTGFSDYKEVKGVKIPSKMTVSFGPQPIDVDISEIKINEGVSDADFE